MEKIVMQSIRERKSVRAFQDRPIAPEVRADIIEAAWQAPSAGCQMLYSIIEVTDQSLKQQLAVTCDNQPFIAQAPMVLIFLADCRRWYDSYGFAGLQDRRPPNTADLMLACADALIAAQNTVIAAQAHGVGSCYIGDIMEQVEEHRQLLHLDAYVYPAAMLLYGYPTQQQAQRAKPERFDEKYLLFENQYRRLDEDEHRTMFADWARRAGKDTFDFDEYIHRFCMRKYQSNFSREMARSMAIYLESFDT